MQDFFSALSMALMVALGAALAFAFQGEPDLWDKWHEIAMAGASCVAR